MGLGIVDRMDKRAFIEKLNESDMVLLGLGEEFDDGERLRQNPVYRSVCESLEKEGLLWLLPLWNEVFSHRLGKEPLEQGLEKLTSLLEGRNYFAVSVSTCSQIACSRWREGRLVMPCGTIWQKQCTHGCRDALDRVTGEEQDRLRQILEKAERGFSLQGVFGSGVKGEAPLGVCPKCGAPFVLNNIYAQNYNEDGYLEQWRRYTKWLQGTLNRRLFVLELGVGMDFPSVVRWPFEKAVFFNRKAFLCRVNGRLYQLTEELAGKGCGISQNAIEWLGQL